MERLNVDVERLRSRIRGFVGEDDWARHWTERRAPYLWRDGERLRLLEESVGYFLAGVKSGEVVVRTNNGRALWSQVQCDWLDYQRRKVLA